MKAVLAKLPVIGKLLAKKAAAAAAPADHNEAAAALLQDDGKPAPEAAHVKAARNAVIEEQQMLRRLIIGVMLVALTLWGGGTVYFVHQWKAAHPKGHLLAGHHPAPHGEAHAEAKADAEHGDDHAKDDHAGAEAHGEGHAETEEHAEASHDEHADNPKDTIGQISPLPKSVRNRQDGEVEPGRDLEEPEISSTRSLASLLTQDLKIEREYRFVTLPGMIASLEFENGFRSSLAAIVVLQVDSAKAEEEVLARQTEFVGAISSLASERTRSKMLNFKGLADFKTSVHSELNHLLRNGQIKDVLFADFFVK